MFRKKCAFAQEKNRFLLFYNVVKIYMNKYKYICNSQRVNFFLKIFYYSKKGKKKNTEYHSKNHMLPRVLRNSETKGLSLESYRRNGRSYGIGNTGTAGSSSSSMGNVVV